MVTVAEEPSNRSHCKDIAKKRGHDVLVMESAYNAYMHGMFGLALRRTFGIPFARFTRDLGIPVGVSKARSKRSPRSNACQALHMASRSHFEHVPIIRNTVFTGFNFASLYFSPF